MTATLEQTILPSCEKLLNSKCVRKQDSVSHFLALTGGFRHSFPSVYIKLLCCICKNINKNVKPSSGFM